MKITPQAWNGEDPAGLAATLRALAPDLDDVSAAVGDVIARVREGGDEALLELSERFDGVRPASLRVEPAECEAALTGIDPELRTALDAAAANINAVCEAQTAGEETVELGEGQTVTIAEVPVRAAGIYAPGGGGAYPSTVLMCALPARAAGVDRLAVASPPGPDGKPSPLVMAACALCEVDELYAVGGAQAIAALALGTETIAPVDVVVGPGSRYVTEAKRQLAGRVGIDSLAGPTELMVVLGEGADEDWAALDLCAQAEHGDDGLLVACAVESDVLDRLALAVDRLAAERATVADPALALIQVPDTDAAIALANELAPEHLQLATEDAELLASGVRTAGCVFVGPAAGAAFGDYVAGSNHVLPTGGAGRFSGPLGPATFTRRTSTVSLPPEAAKALAPDADVLARAEGFPVHGESARARQ